mgnify:CR=1 FL=1
MEKYNKQLNESCLMEMSNVVGRKCVTDKIPFSFYFSSKDDVPHPIRLKIKWNREKIGKDLDGYFELHGNYEYVHSTDADAKKPSSKELEVARQFIKKYKVLFCAVWEGKLDQDDLASFFKGRVKLRDLLSYLEGISENEYYAINHCHTLEEIEQCVRELDIFNMWD